MAFDPDAYLATQDQSTQGFDPDAYLGTKSKVAENSRPLNLSVLGFAAKKVLGMEPMAHPVQNLPLLGALAGSTAANPGMGAAAGAGLAKIAQNMIGIAQGDPNAPRTATAAALPAMGQAAMAGIAQEPQVLNQIPGVPQTVDALKAIGSRIGQGLKRVGEAASGVNARDIQGLFENPGTLFTPGSKAEAGAAIGAAKAAAGVNPGVTQDIGSFTPSNVFKAMKGDQVGENALQQVAEANASGVKPSVEDVGDALKYVSKQIQTGLRQGIDTSEMQNVQSHLNSILDDVAPNVQAARQEYAPIAQRDKFLKLFPTNKNGTISKANLFYLNTLAKGLTAPLRAPVTTGLVTSGLGAGTQAINSIAQNPQARQVLLNVLQKLKSNSTTP